MPSSERDRPQDKMVMLKRIAVFASCTEEQLTLISDRTRLSEYKKGEKIFKEGDTADAFYIVGSGRLRVYSCHRGEEKTFAILHNGDTFGEMSLLTGETHSATIQALNDTLVLKIEKMDFDDVINRIPSLVLYLSRILSKRLRIRQRTGMESTQDYGEATIASIYGTTEDVGCTLLTVSLASSLARETQRRVLLVDLSEHDRSRTWLYESADVKHLRRSSFLSADAERELDESIGEHPLGFNVLFAGELQDEDSEHAIAPLLSLLTKRFSYVLIDLPAQLNSAVLKTLTQSDLIYLVTDGKKPQLVRTKALINQLKSSVGVTNQRMKIVLNRFQPPGGRLNLFSVLQPLIERVDPREVMDQLGQPIAFSLPAITSSEELTIDRLGQLMECNETPYAVTIRRMAREMGGLLVGLALGSGAALGLAHIGVLKVIEREKIPIDMIAGSSIGALVAGLWASGRSAQDLEKMAVRFSKPWSVRKLFLLDIKLPFMSILGAIGCGMLMSWLSGAWIGILVGIVIITFGLFLGPLSGGPIQGSALMKELEDDFEGSTFEETFIPLKVVAADPVQREEVILDSGSIAQAVRASVSIPGIFTPVLHQGRLILDGGVVNPVPVSVLKQAGASRVIAINVFPTTEELLSHRQLAEKKRMESEAQIAARSLPFRFFAWCRQEFIRSVSPLIFDVIVRSMQFMEYHIAEVACHGADITLRPTVAGSHWLDFFHPEQFILRGEEVALEHLQDLRRLSSVPVPDVDNP